MRQLIIKVPSGQGGKVLELAEKQEGVNLAQIDASDRQRAYDLVIVYVPNDKVGPLLGAFEKLPDVGVTIFPHSVIPMSPPGEDVPAYIKEVNERSPIEVWLNGLQSIGSWRGFIGYTVAAGIIVWIGMFTNTIYLLVAAMLIAPFAGPAMNLAIATASGDKTLVWRNLLRYFVALTLTILIAAAISLLVRPETVTPTMVAVSEISTMAVLLPLVGGAAGALNLMQAENNSLVSGTAVGLLIAASLAPPAGLIGMAGAMGRWDMAQNGAFLLVLQLAGINFGGSLLFRAYGLRATRKRYERGTPAIFYLSLAASTLILAGLLAWQLATSPQLQRATVAQQAVDDVQAVVDESDLALLVEANLRFTRPRIEDQNTLLGVIYVQRRPEVTLSNQEIGQDLTRAIQQRILEQGYNVEPVIEVTVLEPAAGDR